jgi:hypothetical protein
MHYLQRLTLGISVLFSLTSPALFAQETKPAPATPIDVKKVELGGNPWDPAWDQIVEKAIPPEMLGYQVPRDVKHFCPRFYDMAEADKRAFWAYFFQALAGAEAGLEPTTRVRSRNPEVARVDKVTGRPVHQEGLLQLTYDDQRLYDCHFDWQKDKQLKPDDPGRSILQPKNNLECGVKILSYQIIVKHKPILNSSSYWQPLRPRNPSYKNFAKQMTNAPAACASPVKSKVADATDTTVTVKQEANAKADGKTTEQPKATEQVKASN